MSTNRMSSVGPPRPHTRDRGWWPRRAARRRDACGPHLPARTRPAARPSEAGAARPSWTSDLEIKEEIRAKLIAEPDLVSGRVDVGVYASQVMLVGVVGSPQKAQQFEAVARSVSGVVSVKSFMQ
jgi:BON domain